jgi:hypothetical protein
LQHGQIACGEFLEGLRLGVENLGVDGRRGRERVVAAGQSHAEEDLSGASKDDTVRDAVAVEVGQVRGVGQTCAAQ